MISYRIVSKTISPQSKKAHKRKHLDPKDPDYKEKLMERVLHNLSFHKGERVRIVNTSKRGIITKIHFDPTQVQWIDGKPYFIELCMDDGDYKLACPYEITRKRV